MTQRAIDRYLLVFGVTLMILQGCASAPPERRPPPRPAPHQPVKPPPVSRPVPLEMRGPIQPEALPELPEPVEMATPEAPAPRHQPAPVVVSLLDEASRLEQQGELARASASIERGLRISPRDAHLWKRLARIRLLQERPQQAESLAKKSISFARGDQGLLADNWLLIAETRQQRHDAIGAERARDKAAQYQQTY